MAVISVGIVNSNGRVILARQFMDISRVRIEGLLSAFPRVRDASVKTQATFVDAGSVRYVYQPLEELFIVLVTTLQSNIVEDLATLQMMSRVVSEYNMGQITESSIEEKSFSIFFAFDEIIVGGKKESATLEQVHLYLEMDSPNEQAYLEQKRIQMEAAKRTTKEQSRILKEKKMLGITRGGSDPYGGFGYDGSGINADVGSNVEMNYSYQTPESYSTPMSGVGMSSYNAKPSKPISGMALGKGKKGGDRLELNVLSKVQKEIGGGRPAASAVTPPPAEYKSEAGAPENVQVLVDERMAVQLSRDGEVSAVEVKGELSILIKENHCERVKFELGPLNNSFLFKAHAKINKDLFASNSVLAMVDGKPFPVNQTVTILRWRASQPIPPPVVFTCWPELGRMTVEYELSTEYKALKVGQLSVTIPLNGQTLMSATPTTGVANVSDDAVHWVICESSTPKMDGSIDITIGDSNMDCGVLFPMAVQFSSPVSLAKVQVSRVVEVDTEMPVRFSEQVVLGADSYQVA